MSAPEPPDLARLRAALASLEDRGEWPEADARRIYEALHGDMTAEERRAVVDELVRNPRAAAAWRLARELAPEQASAPAATHEPRGRMWTWMLAAAAAAALVAGSWQYWPGRLSNPPVYRSTDARRIQSLLVEGAPLSRTEPVLRWTPVEGARYRVRVLTPSLEVIAEAEDVATAEYRLSDDVLRRTAAGSEVLWQVEARAPGSTTVISPTFRVQVQ